MIKIKLLTASVLFTAFTLNLQSQKKSDTEKKGDNKKEAAPKDVIKMNLSQLIFTNLSFQYEYGFHKNMSGALGVSVLIPRDIPSSFYVAPSSTQGFQLPKFGGWSVTPEFRFYPGEKVEHQSPHGFYIAPYFRYSKYSIKSDYNDVGPDPSSPYNNSYRMTASYYGFTGGLMIGSQWLIGKHFSIDWWILGAGAGKARFSIEAISKDPNLNLSPAQQAELRSDINSNVGGLGSFGAGNVSIETTSNSAKVTVSGLPMRSFRGFGFCLGFSF